ncbi:MAG TPA: hypothetical protein VIH08_13345 [Blastococcus sp.]
MYAVGVVEVLAGVLVAVAPRIGGWVVAAPAGPGRRRPPCTDSSRRTLAPGRSSSP